MASRSCRYSGLSILRNPARHQTMNTWPTFSCKLSLRSVFSAHLSPFSVRGFPDFGCLSLAERGNARMKQINMTDKVRHMAGKRYQKNGLPAPLRFPKFFSVIQITGSVRLRRRSGELLLFELDRKSTR